MKRSSFFDFMSVSGRVLSFEAAMEWVEMQISLAELLEEDDNTLYDDIAHIIADVYVRNPKYEVKVDGEWVTYGYLQEVFSELTSEHVQAVAAKFENYTQEIRFKRAFLRTALFNICFEINADVTNAVSVRYGK